MTNKSVLDIDVNDEQFKSFFDLFEKYQEKLVTMPEYWQQVNSATGKAIKQFEGANAITKVLAGAGTQAGKINAELDKASKAQKHFHRVTQSSSNELKKMAGYASSLSKHLFGIGKYLFKVGALGGGISLLGGFGMRELGEGAVRRQIQARGIGLTQGQVRAWALDMKRYIGPSMLQSVANAQSNLEGQRQLMMASGMPMSKIPGMSPDELSYRIMMHQRQLWLQTPKQMRTNSPYIQAGMQFADQADIRRWAHSSPATIQQAHAQYLKDQTAFQVNAADVRNWWAFVRQLGKLGITIETDLTRKLAAVAPALSDLLKAIGSDAVKLIESALSEKNIAAFKAGLGELTSYLGSAQFKKDFQGFEASLKQIWAGAKSFAEIMAGGATLLGYRSTKSGSESGASPSLINAPEPLYKRKKGVAFWTNVETNHPWTRFITKPFTEGAPRSVSGIIGGKKQFLSSLGDRYGLPKGTLWSLYGAESSYGKNAGYSKSGALGPFQFEPKAAQQYGLKDRRDFRQSAVAAARMMKDLIADYQGDIRKAVAAYNWGAGNVNTDIMLHGKRWLSYAPKETQREVGKVMKVVIENKAGSNVAVSANAVAAY